MFSLDREYIYFYSLSEQMVDRDWRKKYWMYGERPSPEEQDKLEKELKSLIESSALEIGFTMKKNRSSIFTMQGLGDMLDKDDKDLLKDKKFLGMVYSLVDDAYGVAIDDRLKMLIYLKFKFSAYL